MIDLSQKINEIMHCVDNTFMLFKILCNEI